MTTAIELRNIEKSFGNTAVIRDVNLRVAPGERHAIIGPNGAGKSTLFNLISGYMVPTKGEIRLRDQVISGLPPYRINRRGLSRSFQVTNVFANMTVWENLRCAVLWATGHKYAFWKNVDDLPEVRQRTAQILQDISLTSRRDIPAGLLTYAEQRALEIGITTAGGADVILLDEPTAGVDVELRKAMWDVVRGLRDAGVTIILTTHYIEEAEEMADRVGVINKGEIVLIEDKKKLMQKLGKKQLSLHLQQKLTAIPTSLAAYGLELGDGGRELVYTYDTKGERTGITTLMNDLRQAGIAFNDLNTKQSSLEEIFVSLVHA